MSDVVRLRVGGVVFEVEKKTLLRVKNTYFHGLLSSGAWQPESAGAYLIDRPSLGFDRIIEYLTSGKLSVEGLSELEKECIHSNMDYFLIRRYTTLQVIEGLNALHVCELKDGRLGCAYNNDIIIWNMESSAVEMTLKGHTSDHTHPVIKQVIQLKDGRVCSCSHLTIKIWNIHSGLCELTLTDHTSAVICIMQLFDGRLCSGAWDETIRVWNISTGVCDMIIIVKFIAYSIVQLADARICCGCVNSSRIYIYSLLTGKCELSWDAHILNLTTIVSIDAARVCSCLGDVWNTDTGELEKKLDGHTEQVKSMVLMQDGRLCSASYCRSLKLWNLETGECEYKMETTMRICKVLQLEDGRLLFTQVDGSVIVWS